ncbi:MAG TPA: hypothetical protein VF080_03855 [Solirubrobacteraceae bacterium]
MLPLAFEVVATPDLFPGHSLSFTDVGFDDVGIRIEYSIAPAIAMRGPGTGWVGHGRDDLGNDYEDVGGAYGPARDGDRTNGVLTMPFPIDAASMLRVRLRPRGDAAGFDDDGAPAYEVLVHLEL